MPDLDRAIGRHRPPEERSGEHESSEKRPGNLLALWFGLLGAPTAWIVGLTLNYALVEVACEIKSGLPLHISLSATLLAAGAATWVAFRQWDRLGRPRGVQGGSGETRSAFMAIVGLALGALFVLAILAQWLGLAFLHPCMGV